MSDQVRTAHLLIKHVNSRNPISRRTNQQITLSEQDAYLQLKQYHADLTQQQQLDPSSFSNHFSNACQQRSDCGSFQNGGDLGLFGRGMMQQPFEEASFSLKIGEMSDVVGTDSGYHLIYRIQ